MNFSIRTAREEDAASIIELLNPIIEAGIYTVMEEQLSVEDQLAFMRGFPDRGLFNVAVEMESSRIVGLQSLEPIAGEANAFRHVGEISTFVALDAHGKGIGGGLSKATFQGAQELGYRKITATIRADNPGAVDFYLSQGFRIVGVAHEHAFLGGKYVDEVLAERFLDEEG